MKKVLILPIAATLLFTPQQEVRADWGDFMAGLFGVGVCAAAVGAVGSAAYHLCKELSDQEEVDRAKQLHNNSKSTYERESNNNREALYIHSTKPSHYLMSTQLSRHITSTSSYWVEFPFLKYKQNLDSSITKINNKIWDIESKRSHLRKRKTKLHDNRELTYHERFKYEQDYDYFSDKLLRIKRKLSDLHASLKNLRTTVLSLDGYREDLRKKEEKERIERLERKIEKLRRELRNAQREAREYQYNARCINLQNRIYELEKEKNSFNFYVQVDL